MEESSRVIGQGVQVEVEGRYVPRSLLIVSFSGLSLAERPYEASSPHSQSFTPILRGASAELGK